MDYGLCIWVPGWPGIAAGRQGRRKDHGYNENFPYKQDTLLLRHGEQQRLPVELTKLNSTENQQRERLALFQASAISSTAGKAQRFLLAEPYRRRRPWWPTITARYLLSCRLNGRTVTFLPGYEAFYVPTVLSCRVLTASSLPHTEDGHRAFLFGRNRPTVKGDGVYRLFIRSRNIMATRSRMSCGKNAISANRRHLCVSMLPSSANNTQ